MAASESPIEGLLMTILRVAVVLFAAYSAYHIRMYAIDGYGRLIHEFDPWFNFRATQYLFDNGVSKFFKWCVTRIPVHGLHVIRVTHLSIVT